MIFPKILILNQPFTKTTGGGITLSNLFEGWDKDKIAVACTPHYFNQKIETTVCDTYYRLGEKEYKNKFPFNLLQHSYPSGPIDFKTATPEKEKVIKKVESRKNLLDKFLYPSLEYIGLFHDLTRIEISAEFQHWLDTYEPEIIYVQAFSLEGVRFCLAVEDYLNKPMVFHMMDDWPSSVSERGPFKKYWAKKIDAEFRALLNKSSLLLSISEGMTRAYKKRYDKEFIPFHNPIHLNFWKKDQRTEYELNDCQELLYSGRTGIGINDSLQLTAQAVEEINAELGSCLTFILRAGEKPVWIDKYKSAQFKNYVDYQEIPKTLAEADLLILPYDFSEESIKFVKYSMPTKASEYMMSGTPTLLFAPEETALADYARTHDCFELVLQNDIESLKKAIKTLLQDKKRRRQLGQTAAEVAERYHDADKVVADFRKRIFSLT